MNQQELLNQLFNLVEDHFTNEQLDKWLWYCWQMEGQLARTMNVRPIVKNGALTWTDGDLAALRTFCLMVQISKHASVLWNARKVYQSVSLQNSMNPYPNLAQDFQ